MNSRTRQKAALTLLSVFIALLQVGCTYVWRREFRTTSDDSVPTVSGWAVSAKIVSLEQRSPKKKISTPTEFAISFWAVRPRPVGTSVRDLKSEDIYLDSAVARYEPSGLRERWILNSGGWVSYESISPQELVKVFSEPQGSISGSKWHTIAPDVTQLKIELYARTTLGRLIQKPRDSNTMPIDSIIADPDEQPSVVGPIEMTLTVRDVRLQVPGFMPR